MALTRTPNGTSEQAARWDFPTFLGVQFLQRPIQHEINATALTSGSLYFPGITKVSTRDVSFEGDPPLPQLGRAPCPEGKLPAPRRGDRTIPSEQIGRDRAISVDGHRRSSVHCGGISDEEGICRATIRGGVERGCLWRDRNGF